MQHPSSLWARLSAALCLLLLTPVFSAQSGPVPGAGVHQAGEAAFSVSRCLRNGDIAYNRGPAVLPSSIPHQFCIFDGCPPHELVGWTPHPWPKYDAWRDVVFLDKPLQPGGYQLHTLDACSGEVTPFVPQPPHFAEGIAPVGDGRVYLLSGVLNYLDANDVLHPVIATDGNQFQWPQNFVSDMVYDALSNSLILLSSTNGTGGPCTPPSVANAVVTKIPLNAAGDQVIAPVTNVAFCAGDHNTSVPRIARHVDGRLLFRVGVQEVPNVEVVWLETVNMTTHWFCTELDNPGTGYQLTGGKSVSAYSAALGGILDVTHNSPCGPGCTSVSTLRFYAEGTISHGVPLCSWQDENRWLFVEFVK
jgi:hypothetical protein